MTEYVGKTKFGDVEFTKDQIADYQEAFTQFDIDGDGTVTTQVNYLQNRGQKEINILNLCVCMEMILNSKRFNIKIFFDSASMLSGKKINLCRKFVF